MFGFGKKRNRDQIETEYGHLKDMYGKLPPDKKKGAAHLAKRIGELEQQLAGKGSRGLSGSMLFVLVVLGGGGAAFAVGFFAMTLFAG